MNGQVNYIIHASLLLIVSASAVFFFRKIPLSPDSGKPQTSKEVSQTYRPVLSPSAINGKELFKRNCASCHVLNKNTVGPDLIRVTEREPWTNRQNVYDWIRDPGAFALKNDYAKQLMESFTVRMQSFLTSQMQKSMTYVLI